MSFVNYIKSYNETQSDNETPPDSPPDSSPDSIPSPTSDNSKDKIVNLIPLSVMYYSQWAYVQVREIIEYYIPLSNNEDIHEIYPNLFIGNMSTVFNIDYLKQHNISHIVSAIYGFSPPYPNDFKYHIVNALDSPSFNIKPFLNDACFFIESALKNNRKVYVHCMCGVSRSSTIIAAYLLGKMGNSYDTPEKIIEYLQSIRKIINPNSGFRKQLEEYAKE